MRRAPALLAFVVMLGLGSDVVARKVNVTPWFEYSKEGPLIDIPHVFVSRPYQEIVRVRVGGQWRQVIDSQSNVAFHGLDPTPFDGGHAVLVRDGDPKIFREGVLEPVELQSPTCAWPEVSQDRRHLLCIYRLNEHGIASRSNETVTALGVDLRDAKGAVVRSVQVAVPKPLADAFAYGGSLIGWTSKGVAVIGGETLSQTPGEATYVALALEEPVMRELARLTKKYRSPTAAEWTKLIPGLVI
jgi:hypothetical protein